MPDVDRALGRTLTLIAGEVDGGDGERVAARAVSDHRLTRRRRLWLGAIAVPVCAVIVSQASGVLAPPSSAPASSGRSAPANSTVDGDWINLPSKPGEPCPGAQRHTVEQLAAIAGVPVWLPDAPAASTASLTGAWTCGGDTPILTFGPVQISYESGYGNVTIAEWCRGLSEQMAVDGQIELVGGYLGCVLPSTGPGVLTEILVVVDDGVLIRVLADRSVPVDDLVQVVNSIDLAHPVEG